MIMLPNIWIYGGDEALRHDGTIDTELIIRMCPGKSQGPFVHFPWFQMNLSRFLATRVITVLSVH
jgi:hypothetical protein